MEFLYIKKKSKTENWSDVLERQYLDLVEVSDNRIQLLEIDTSSPASYVQSAVNLNHLLKDKRIKTIYVNHIICAYACLLAPRFHKGSFTKIIALHEGEPVMGWDYVLQNFKGFSLKEMCRYSFIFHFPPFVFDKIYILNKSQALQKTLKNRYRQVNFLGVDEKKFSSLSLPTNETGGVLRVFFPNNPKRPEKGFKVLQNALTDLGKNEIEVITGGTLNFDEMSQAYNNSDVVVVTSIYETYSLVCLEAMACNKLIVANNKVGIIDNLLEKYNAESLAQFGIFVINDNNSNQLANYLKLIKEKEPLPRTRELLLMEGLDERNINAKLFSLLGKEGK